MQEYLDRLTPCLKVVLQWHEKASNLENFIQTHPKALILDAEGTLLDSPQFHNLLYERSLHNKGTIEIVIGPDVGLSESIKKQAQNSKRLISLSRMTFTHQMCRLLVLEQVYRAISIEKRMPYHK